LRPSVRLSSIGGRSSQELCTEIRLGHRSGGREEPTIHGLRGTGMLTGTLRATMSTRSLLTWGCLGKWRALYAPQRSDAGGRRGPQAASASWGL